MRADLARIEIYEVPDAVVRYAPQLGPFPQSANRRLLACREYTARAEADDVRELAARGCFVLCFHAYGCVSTDAASPRELDPVANKVGKVPSWNSLGKRRAGPTLIWVVPFRCVSAMRPPAVKSCSAGSFPLEFKHWGIGT